MTPEAAARGVRVVTRSLGEDGPLGRDELRARLVAAGVPLAGQALVHILFQASLDGLIVRGPVIGGDHCYVTVADWLGNGPTVDPDIALAELARRYLVGHGPATEGDLAAWAGVNLGAARAALRGIGAELTTVPADRARAAGSAGSGGVADLADVVDLAGRESAAPRLPEPRLLGPFDPLLHGWRDRRPILGDQTTVVTTNGIFRPILLAGGRAVATWGLAGGVVRLAPFQPLTPALLAAARREAHAVSLFLGMGPLAMEVVAAGEVSRPPP